MDMIITITTILGVLFIGAMSPGPSFILVARTSIAQSRRNGLSMALGMGAGGAFFAITVLIGLHTILQTLPWLYMALKVLVGLYLIFLAVQIWRSANKTLSVINHQKVKSISVFKSFWLALLTQISNPKALVIYGSIFAALLPPDLPVAIAILLPFLVFMVEFLWYAIVAYLLSSSVSYGFYAGCKTVIDRVASAIMALLGTRLLMTTDSTSLV